VKLIVFINLMLPLILLLLGGVIARRCLQVEAKPLSKLTLYLLSPALVFNSLVRSDLAGFELLKLAFGTVALILGLSFLVSLLGYLLGWSPRLVSAMKLGAVFTNVGNYSLPIIVSLFGNAGLERVAVIIVAHQLLMCSLAVYFAARSHFGAWRSFTALLRMPTAYAALAALVWRQQPAVPPQFLLQTTGLLAQAALPIFLLLLGVQLSGATISPMPGLLCLGSLIKLAASPVWAAILALGLGLEQLSGYVLILAAAAPTAIVTTMLAIEFNAEPELVSSLTLCTTLLSLASVPLVISALGLT
jgi:predicted permease